MPALLADSVTATAAYCRQARRIRASYCSAPLLRQRALIDLAARRNAESRPLKFAASPLGITSTVERDFSDHAGTCLQDFGFTYSNRLKLLNSAERLGIARFRANMLLALLEHQAPARRSAAPEIPSRSLAPSLLVILSIEMAVIGVLVMLVAL